MTLRTLRQGRGDSVEPGLLEGLEDIDLFGNRKIYGDHGIRLPVRVIQMLPIAGDRERVLEPFENLASARLAGLQTLHPTSACVHPAELRRVGIERQPVRQAQVLLHENPPVRPIHVRSFNFGAISVPVRPVKIPLHGVGHDASGVHQVGVKQHPALSTIQLCNFYSVQVRIRPENVAAKMVKGDAFWTSKILSNDGGWLSTMQTGSPNGRLTDVGPVNHLVHTVEGQSNDDFIRGMQQRPGFCLLQAASFQGEALNLPCLSEE